MCPRPKRVRRGEQVHEYVLLVEGHRVDGKVRQRVVATLGRLDELKASGQLDRWAGAFGRLDPPPVGTRREVGPLLLVAHYLRRLGLVDLVDKAASMRGRSLLSHGEVIAALVANRLTAPAPLYDVAGWAGQAAMAELLSVPAGLLNDDRLGRALEASTNPSSRPRSTPSGAISRSTGWRRSSAATVATPPSPPTTGSPSCWPAAHRHRPATSATTSRRTTLPRSTGRPTSPSESAPLPARIASTQPACRTSSGFLTVPAGRWSATPATPRTRSPRKESATHSPAPSSAPPHWTRRSPANAPTTTRWRPTNGPATSTRCPSTTSPPRWRRSSRRHRRCNSSSRRSPETRKPWTGS
jgi:hypothetical protein